MNGVIFDIAECSIHDGPGMRITVFFKGCPLRCRWCHSPEGQSRQIEWLQFPGLPPRQCGRIWDSRQLADHLLARTKLLDGGITFSGGEPLMQSDFLLELLAAMPETHTLLDSCGFAENAVFLAVTRQVKMVYFGLKLLNEQENRFWTGQSSRLQKENLLLLDRETATPYRLRIPLLPHVTGEENYLRELEKFCRQLKRIEAIDFLPSNPEAGAKYPGCSRKFDPGFDPGKTAELPGWFAPGCPVNQLSSGRIS